MDFSVVAEAAVVGFNPEMVDMTSPNGEIMGWTHFIVATQEDGRRLRHTGAAALTRNGQTLEGSTPVEVLGSLANFLNDNQPNLDMNFWQDWVPVYGSEEFVAQERSGMLDLL
jgi:hypothetical protein